MNKKYDHQFPSYVLYFNVWSPHFGTNSTPVITTICKQSPESNHDVRLPPIPGCPQISLDLDTTVTVYYHTDLKLGMFICSIWLRLMNLQQTMKWVTQNCNLSGYIRLLADCDCIIVSFAQLRYRHRAQTGPGHCGLNTDESVHLVTARNSRCCHRCSAPPPPPPHG